MNTSEKIQECRHTLAYLLLDIDKLKAETSDMATRLWLDKASAKMDDVLRTLNNAHTAAEKSEGLP